MKQIIGVASFLAIQARKIDWGSTAVAAVIALSWAERRINRVFESYKGDLSIRLRDPLIPWIEYDTGSIGRFCLLWRGYGLRVTVRMLMQNAVCDRCKNWSGAERRIKRGALSARSTEAMRHAAGRFTDS
ncbi:MAG: hypothetical protein LAO19_22010, partial [Acidobacteriia bacterium]|nr:hypothetical protein [Terriglobia bacterium]